MNIEPRRRILDSLPAHLAVALALLGGTCALVYVLAADGHLVALLLALVVLVPVTARVYSTAQQRVVDALEDAATRCRARKVRAGWRTTDEWLTQRIDVVDLDELPGRHALDAPTTTIPAVTA